MTRADGRINSLRERVIEALFAGNSKRAHEVEALARSQHGWQNSNGRQVFVCRVCGTHTREHERGERDCCLRAYLDDLNRQR